MLHSLRRGTWFGGVKALQKTSIDPQAQFVDCAADGEAFAADTDGTLVPYVGTDDEAVYMVIFKDVAGRRAKGYLRGRRTEAVGSELLVDPDYGTDVPAGVDHVIIYELPGHPGLTAAVTGGVASFAAVAADGGAEIISEEDAAAQVPLARFRMAVTIAGDDIGRQFLFNKDIEDA